jgi:hypothetical protein
MQANINSVDLTNGQNTGLNVWFSTVDPVPEPSGLTLLGTGLLSVAGAVRRKFMV